MNRIVLTILLIMLLSGCAAQGVNTYRHDDGTPVMVNNEIRILKPQSHVWDILVKEIAKSFFVINNIDKESRIINVSFSTDTPAKYVDCGKTHRTYTQGGKTEKYDYETAGSSVFKAAAPRQFDPTAADYALISRVTTLEGRSNIYVALDEQNNNITVLTVNTRYILNVKTRGEIFSDHIDGHTFSRGTIPEETNAATFSTNRLEPTNFGGGDMITCFSKGVLEKQVLDMVQSNGN